MELVRERLGMRQILFEIPLQGAWNLGPLGEVAGFGFGIVLLLWLLVGGTSLYRDWRREGRLNSVVLQSLAFLVTVGIGIVLVPTFAPQPKVPVYGYGAMLVIGAILSGWTAATRSKFVGVEPQFSWDLAIKLVLTGVLGSRIFYLVQYRQRVYANCQGVGDYLKATVNLTEGGLVLYGGLILGTLTYFLICKRRGLDPLKFGDAVVPAVFIGEACGRIGCLLNGCCYGDPCSLPWGICFPHESVPWISLVQRGFLLETADTTFPLHPTQIYSSINALVLAALTAVYYRHRVGNGSVLALAIMGYALSRSCIEVLRGDELGQFGTVFTISQWVSLLVFLAGAALAWWSWRHSEPRLTSAPPFVPGS